MSNPEFWAPQELWRECCGEKDRFPIFGRYLIDDERIAIYVSEDTDKDPQWWTADELIVAVLNDTTIERFLDDETAWDVLIGLGIWKEEVRA